MARLLISAAAAFSAGMLMAIPMGMSVNAKDSMLWAIPMAFVFVAGVVVCAWLFFAPNQG